MECPKCFVEMGPTVVAVYVSPARSTLVDALTCLDCGETYVPVGEEPVPAGVYEAHQGAPDEPLTEEDVDRMFAEGY
jgi:hypothetical protein